MAIVFNGRNFAKEKEIHLAEKVLQLKKKGIIPKLVSFVVGDIDGAMKYQEMKKNTAERVGISVRIQQFPEDVSLKEIETEIERYNKDKRIHGIMIQLPLPKVFSEEDKKKIIQTIAKGKDVDGMREDSPFVAPVMGAVMDAFQNAKFQMTNDKLRTRQIPGQARYDNNSELQVVVVGSEGFEGKKMVKAFGALGYKVQGLDRKLHNAVFINHEISHADVVVSCTGSPASVVGQVIKPGAICIDVGAPKGDFEFESVSQKASFITPVPGSIGPVTIISLMENIVEAAS